ncbi:MAG: DUF4340 domain-containing protein [Planctomycetes bacterium]|nr:DUF4340 domain-containing protein [Planctomycetota bacterium]MBL7146937.1 DUF4340 domain-containing protein [Phycisphaerae bacterium]
MSNKNLTILGIVAVLMAIWAVAQSHVSNRPRTETDGPSYLIQGLDPADIDSIVLGGGEEPVTLKREQGNFVVVDKDNYPAKASEINNLITKVLEIQTSQFVTDNASNHEDLGLTEENATATIKFFKADSSLLTGVVGGKKKELGQGVYVRLASNDAAYVVPTMPWIADTAISYIEQDLVSMKREDIVSVTVSSANGQYTLKTTEDGKDVILENVPAGKKFKSSEGDSVFTALTSLRCDDVMKKSGDLTFDKEYVCTLKNSTVYALKIAQKDGKTYATFEADYTDKTPITKDSNVESEEELKKKEAKLFAQEGAIKFTTKHKGWVYEIAEWKAKNLIKELSELIEDEAPPEDEPEQADTVIPEETTTPTIE